MFVRLEHMPPTNDRHCFLSVAILSTHMRTHLNITARSIHFFIGMYRQMAEEGLSSPCHHRPVYGDENGGSHL